VDDPLKELMQEFGNAINQSLSESESMAEVIAEIRQSGYDVSLVLQATIGLNKRKSEGSGTELDSGTDPLELLTLDSSQGSISDWTPDDGSLAVDDRGPMAFAVIQIDSGYQAAKEIEWIQGWGAVFSPDGEWLAYVGSETGVFEIYVRSWPEGNVVRQISTSGGVEPRWCPCGELFYRAGDSFWSVEIQTEPELSWQAPKLAFETDFIDTPGISYDISSDGNRLYVVKQAKPDITDRIHVVANWSDEVARLVSESK